MDGSIPATRYSHTFHPTLGVPRARRGGSPPDVSRLPVDSVGFCFLFFRHILTTDMLPVVTKVFARRASLSTVRGALAARASFRAFGTTIDMDNIKVLNENDNKWSSKDNCRIPFTDFEAKDLPAVTDILDKFEEDLQRKTQNHAGYPYNLNYNFEELFKFMNYSINNLGDPFVTSNYGVHSRAFETSVVDFFARLWKLKDEEYWGYVTSCGTEGNLHSVLVARECHPEGILMSSTETHYSIFKACRAYRMDYEPIDTTANGEINYDILDERIGHYAGEGRDIILNCNLGTTVRGAVDDVDRIISLLAKHNVNRENFHIHCDGALFGLMMPLLIPRGPISFEKPIDSIAVSGHKMLGCPMPCGITVTRKKHLEKMSRPVEYLNSVDTTIMGSRNGHAALYMWYALRTKGIDGLQDEVRQCFVNAEYLHEELLRAGVKAERNELSTTVVLERPNAEFVRKWQLACEGDIAHVVVMPNITKAVVDDFVAQLKDGGQ